MEERTSATITKPTAATTTPFTCLSSSSGCSTCPNRESCGFKNPAKHCPGTESKDAGLASACSGCPNQALCRSRAAATQDPDLLLIQARMKQIKHTIVVLSGKGGVGKSTFSAQLAFALASKKMPGGEEEEPLWQVGLMDVDICGPSIPTMLGIEKESIHATSSGMTPAYVSENLAAVSVGFLLEDQDEAVVWRGPRKNGIIKQFLRDVDWGNSPLDWLVVDTPPGTSDEHLSVVQYFKGVADGGAIIVTTPQDVALIDVRKEIRFCQKVGLKIIGVVENMASFICPCCHKEEVIFPRTSGGAETMCKEMNVKFLGRIPLDPIIARSCDEGKPYFVAHPESPATKQFLSLFDSILKSLTQ